MAPEDQEQLRQIIHEEITAGEQHTTTTMAAAITASEARTTGAIAASEARTIAAIAASEERAAERARDLQTEVLRGLEAFARGNFARI